MPMFDSQTGAEWGRVGGLTSTARHDPKELAQSGQNGLLRRFMAEVDPEGLLPEAERLERAKRLRVAHMRRLNLQRTAKRRAERMRTATTG